ncbi:hypothetical protein NXW31_05750 [Bacteroides fragilis]|nr:hypothetical protein [Bacteroides fragilis]
MKRRVVELLHKDVELFYNPLDKSPLRGKATLIEIARRFPGK